ncbi:protein HEXIM1-like [Mercenaria mercenaria]|uniref:protein HEXIM1-like n=1 Tax=Mercenaria mercenaria TaxID=6596 RepID=UPI00234EA1F1|nr:protein HEXIM1-like [Mercenaria mercenaria]XP_045166769.2 protein HEXIM1-like [Mercenaria mercenaria]XP_045166770.2 protein HEXIM1-like [Mercenaria mercenaria]XP_045166771.2 protein HEXIM1-like [Mercenaria mercenaria]
MFVMDTKKIVTGLKNTEILDTKMAETLKRKKTRRGKKNRMRKSPGNNYDVFSTFPTHNPYTYRGQRNSKFIRPSSPKAPMNSTQFLIEDRGHDQIDFDYVLQYNQSPVFHGLLPEIQDYTSLSFYDDENEKSKDSDGEFEYMPIDFEDTADFIGQEFEKDLHSHHIKCSDPGLVSSCTRRELSRLPKYTIIQRMFELEEKMNRLESDAQESRQDDLKTKIGQLKEENSTLKIYILAQV